MLLLREKFSSQLAVTACKLQQLQLLRSLRGLHAGFRNSDDMETFDMDAKHTSLALLDRNGKITDNTLGFFL